AVARRQDEAVSVGPARIGGIELQMPREQRRGRIGHTHRHAWMTAVRGLDRVHRKGANGVGETAFGQRHYGSVCGVASAGGLQPMARSLCRASRAASMLAANLHIAYRSDDGRE